MHSFRKLAFLAGLLCTIVVPASWAHPNEGVIVMTKNMDAGTDFGFFFDNLQTDPALGVQLTFAELQKNDFALRAGLLAREIAAARPHLVGLQEVTSLHSGPVSGPLNNVVMDQLLLLTGALAALGQPYNVVVQQTNLDVAFPVSANLAVQITDRDVILARADLPAGSITNIHNAHYQTILSLGPIASYRGWVSADLTVGSHSLRFVTTHLESSGGLYGNPAVDFIQAAQAQELAGTFVGSPLPLVIAGDLNSNALHTPPEQTPSYEIVLGTGASDSWTATHRGEPGFTWPMYVEDPLGNHPRGPFERIDFVFARGFSIRSAERTGAKGLHSSDHAGVVAALEF